MDAKVTSIVAYLGWIGWLIAFLAGDKEGAKHHLNQTLIIYLICFIPCIGSICGLILWVMGLISAIQGTETPLPVIGNWHLLK